MPVSGLLLFYLRILWRILQIQRRVTLQTSGHHHTLRNVTLTVISLLAATLLCWTPITVYWLYKYLPRLRRPPSLTLHTPFGYSDQFKYIGDCCIFLHCALLPLIQFMSGSSFRRESVRWLPSPLGRPVRPSLPGLETLAERVQQRTRLGKLGEEEAGQSTGEEEVHSEEERSQHHHHFHYQPLDTRRLLGLNSLLVPDSIQRKLSRIEEERSSQL